MRLKFRSFLRGLWVTPPRELSPEGTLRRATGIRNALSHAVRSRWGLTRLYDAAANSGLVASVHSLVRFATARWAGIGTIAGPEGVPFVFGLDGTPLTFLTGYPTAEGGLGIPGVDRQRETPEYLFAAGGGRLWKSSTGGIGPVTNWGIEPPPDGMGGGRIDLQAGVNFRFWERFNDLAGYEVLERAANLHLSTSVVPPDNLSATSVSFGVGAGRSGRIQRQFRDEAGTPVCIDLRTFGQRDSSLQDWIVLDVLVDKPRNLESFQLGFSTLDVLTDNTHVREIVVDDAILRDLTEDPEGIGDIATVRGDQPAAVEPDAPQTSADRPPPSQTFVKRAVESLAVTKLAAHDNTWTRLKIPKSSFFVTALPPGVEPWQNLCLFTIRLRANKNGPVNVWLDNGSMFGGTGQQGTYKYLLTYLNSNTGTRSNPNETPLVIEDSFRTGNRLSNLPGPLDRQVTDWEIWRTVGNGSVYFRVATLPISELPTFDDHVADFHGMHDLPDTEVLEQLELVFDNVKPEDTFEDAVGPHLGRVWWTRNTVRGRRGRVYYSPSGRLEAVQGFLELSHSDESDPMQKAVVWNGNLYACSYTRWWEIQNVTEPFIGVEIFGMPGTRYPHTVVATPYGVIWLADDGVRRFDGAQSELVAFDAVATLFRGEPAIGLAPFPTGAGLEGVKAAWCFDEYILTDGTRTLALNLRTGAWRDVGIGLTALHCERDTGLMTVARQGRVYVFEPPGVVTDDGVAIPFQVEVPAVVADAGQETTVAQRLYLDIHTHGQVLAASVFAHDGRIAQTGGPVAVLTTQRETVEIALCATVGVGYVNLVAPSGLTEQVELFGVELDAHVPEGRPA